MSNYIEFEYGLFGTKAIIKGHWQDSYLNLVIEKNVKELELDSLIQNLIVSQ